MFLSFQVTVKDLWGAKWVPSCGDCDISWHPKTLLTSVGAGVCVDVGNRKIKVGVIVGVFTGVRDGKGVKVEVRVGGMRAAVSVAAAAAVCATINLIAPGIGVEIC